jgi:hypothetical protein
MIDINKFLQLNNPDIARQTRNMSYFDALKSEIPGTKSYQGYNPFYKGADKTGLSGYFKQGIDSVQGKFKPGSNVGGATWLTRKLAQDTTRLGIGASSIGRSALGRTLGTLLGGTVVGTGGILTSPYIAMANHLYGPNVQKAQDFAGMYGEAMPEDMYEEYSSYLGKPGTSAEPPTGIMNIETPKGFDYNFDENVLKEEEDAQYNLDNKRSFNMDGIVQNLGRGLQKTAQYIGGSQIGGGLASIAGLNPLGIAIGALTGGKFFGGADTSMTPMDRYNQNTFGGYGNMGVQDRYGINTVSFFGDYNRYANKMANKPGPFQSYYQDVVNKQNKQEAQQFADIRQQSESSGGYNPSTGYTAETASGLEGTGGSHHGYSTDYSSPF